MGKQADLHDPNKLQRELVAKHHDQPCLSLHHDPKDILQPHRIHLLLLYASEQEHKNNKNYKLDSNFNFIIKG